MAGSVIIARSAGATGAPTSADRTRTANVRGRIRAIFLLTIGALVVAMMGWFPMSATADGTGATVSGHVTLAPSGQLPDANQFLVYYTCNSPEVTGQTCESTTRDTSVFVDPAGNFSISGIQGAGHYTFYVLANDGGYATAQRDVEITDPNGTYSGVDVTLQPVDLISGRVNLGSDDDPAGAGAVAVYAVQYPDAVSSEYPGSGGRRLFGTDVQSDGSYQLGVTPGYYYRIEFLPLGSSVYPDAWWTNGGPPVDTSIDAAAVSIPSAGATITANMTIPVGATISGSVAFESVFSMDEIIVYDAADGRKVPGYGYEYLFYAHNRNFTLGPLLPGSYHVIADADAVQPLLVGEDDDAYHPRDFDLAANETVSGLNIQVGQFTEVQPGVNCTDCGGVDPDGFIHLEWTNPSSGQWEEVPPSPTLSHVAAVDGGVDDLIPGTYRFWSRSPFGGITYGSPFSVSDGAELLVPFTFSILPRDVEITGELANSGLREDFLSPGSSAFGWLTMQPTATPDSIESTAIESAPSQASVVAAVAAAVFPRPWYLDPIG